MPQWQLQHGESYLVTGEPVIVSDLNSSITHSIELLLVAVLLVMAATLGLIFSGRPRLLPLAVALLATALTFGALSVGGCVADDGLDRGAAGAGRARGRLRDPVPVARRGGVARFSGSGAERVAVDRAHGRPRRTDARDGCRGERGGDTRAGALAGADGPRLRRAAGGGRGHRAAVRADRRARRRSCCSAARARARAAQPRQPRCRAV